MRGFLSPAFLPGAKCSDRIRALFPPLPEKDDKILSFPPRQNEATLVPASG